MGAPKNIWEPEIGATYNGFLILEKKLVPQTKGHCFVWVSKCVSCGKVTQRVRKQLIVDHCFCKIKETQLAINHPFRTGKWRVSKRGELSRRKGESL